MNDNPFRNPPIDITPAPAGGARVQDKEPDMANSTLQRFIGGPPTAVLLRLLFVSLVVGALLVWLDIRPLEIFNALQRFVNRLWTMGWDAVREVAQYVLAGAVIVLPVWLLMRLFNMRGAK
ncbi:MAG TPA: DUF6460 domain-containing protein [Rhodoblastus sp.]|nr:DUF6460 domain-containing protein [Rhodoblastus sp.]